MHSFSTAGFVGSFIPNTIHKQSALLIPVLFSFSVAVFQNLVTFFIGFSKRFGGHEHWYVANPIITLDAYGNHHVKGVSVIAMEEANAGLVNVLEKLSIIQ